MRNEGLKIEILLMAETHWTNETVKAIHIMTMLLYLLLEMIIYTDRVLLLSSQKENLIICKGTILSTNE